jgi:hypothetical protein
MTQAIDSLIVETNKPNREIGINNNTIYNNTILDANASCEGIETESINHDREENTDNSTNLSYLLVSNKKAGFPQTKWRNKKRDEIGKPPVFSKNKVFNNIQLYREKAMELHGINFDTMYAPSGKMLKGFKYLAIYVDMESLMDWWFDKGGEYANYTPDAFISESTINKFKSNNKNTKIWG